MFDPLFAQGTAATIGIAILAILALLFLFGVGVYNGLVTLRNRYKNAYSQIDVQLKRRYDLIPNLVETVKGYMQHEKGTLEAVISARNAALAAGQKAAADPGDPSSMQSLARAEAELGGSLSRLIAVAEAYPELKANETMATLQEELRTTENKVGFARQAFNDAVMQYNNSRDQFPAVIIANLTGFAPAAYFEIDSPKEREAPKVALG
jgi:LemA protein